MPLWPQSASPTEAKEAVEHGPIWRATQGGARLRRHLPWAGMLRAFSASAASRPGMPGARQAPPADSWRRRGLKARTTVVTGARLGPPVALWLNYQWLTEYHTNQFSPPPLLQNGDDRLKYYTFFTCRQHSSVVEQLIRNEQVLGSNPSAGSSLTPCNNACYRRAFSFAGSTPRNGGEHLCSFPLSFAAEQQR